MRNVPTDRSLELSPERIEEWTRAATRRIIDFLESLPEQPAASVEGGAALARSVDEVLPEEGESFDALMDRFFADLVPNSFNTAGPGYLAYIPGGGLYQSALADLIAGAVNRYVGVWIAAPALTQLEINVVRWFCEIVGYPRDALGFLTTGGSLANFSAIVAARVDRLPEDFLSGTLYVSDQTHHSVEKAARIAGFPRSAVRIIGTDDDFRIRLPELAAAIDRDRADGRRPFMVVGSAGTTNTGAVDDLTGLADLCVTENLWFHVDAAYGGFFQLTRRGRERMRGLERSDSLALDPHKGLFLPYGTGSLLVRDPAKLQRAYSSSADYMPPMQESADFVDFCEISPELSRDFRGLRVWLPLKLHGIAPFRNNLEEKLDLAEWAATQLEQIPEVRVVAPPQLSILAFRLEPGGLDRQQLNALNRRLLDQINSARRIYLTPTTVDGDFLIRIAVVSFRTHRERMEQGLEDIRAACRLMLESPDLSGPC